MVRRARAQRQAPARREGFDSVAADMSAPTRRTNRRPSAVTSDTTGVSGPAPKASRPVTPSNVPPRRRRGPRPARGAFRGSGRSQGVHEVPTEGVRRGRTIPAVLHASMNWRERGSGSAAEYHVTT
jgi:hypothetical protein